MSTVFFLFPNMEKASPPGPLNLCQRCWKPIMPPRDVITRIRQKSADLRKIVQTALDRNRKKLSLQQKQMKDTEKKDKYKVYGELINTYGYGLEEGCKSFKAVNYYNGEEITIPLDPTLTPPGEFQEVFRSLRQAEAYPGSSGGSDCRYHQRDRTSGIHLQCPGHCR